MDTTTIITSIITSGVVALITGFVTYFIQERRLNRQFALERERLEEEYRTQRRADFALTQFLNHVKFKRRSFEYIREKIGGFSDDELRIMLVRNGAVRSYSREANVDKKDWKEWWELLGEIKVEPEN
jgi:hypothetical protein